MFIDLREREREMSIGCLPYIPNSESNPQPNCVPWLRTKPAAFWLQNDIPTNLHLARQSSIY